jgi:spore maturation protein CgeB
MMESKWSIVIPPVGAARVVAKHLANSFLNKLGASRVKIFDSLTYQNSYKTILKTTDENLIVDLCNQSLIVSCLDFDTTHFLSGALSPVSLFSLNILKKQGIKTAHWFYEDFRRAHYWNDVLPGYNVFFTIQEGPFPERCHHISTKWHYLPTAASVEPHTTVPDEKRDFDIAFIGIPSPYRIRTLEQIVSSGVSCIIAGLGWDKYTGSLKNCILSGKWIEEAQSALIFRRARIGLNLSVDDPAGISDIHLSPRVFDILISGCVLLTEETPLSHQVLHRCSFETFSLGGPVNTQIKEILSNYTRYKKDTLANIEAVKSFHLYSNRVDEILKLTE